MPIELMKTALLVVDSAIAAELCEEVAKVRPTAKSNYNCRINIQHYVLPAIMLMPPGEGATLLKNGSLWTIGSTLSSSACTTATVYQRREYFKSGMGGNSLF